MINKVIKLASGMEILVVDELKYKNRRFSYGVVCNTKNEEVSNQHIVVEVKLVDNKIIVDNVNDFETASVINDLFIKRMMEN